MKINTLQILQSYEGKPVHESKIKRDEKGKSEQNEDGSPVLEEVCPT